MKMRALSLSLTHTHVGQYFTDVSVVRALAARWQALLYTAGLHQPIVTVDEKTLLFNVWAVQCVHKHVFCIYAVEKYAVFVCIVA
jgi:hypothetical protein